MPLTQRFLSSQHGRSIVLSVFLGCIPVASQAGTLQFFTQGEDLATQGFVAPKLTKDGWTLQFDHLWVTLAEVTAYQTQPPFDPQQPGAPQVVTQVVLPGVHTVDLVQDAGEDHRLRIGEMAALPGHYNAISWRMVPAPSGPAEGQVMLLQGTATRDGVQLPFSLRSDWVHAYLCGEYIGDERKGFVEEGALAEVEMTFHLDHIFGRSDKAGEDPMNVAALGFDSFATSSETQRIALEGLHIGHAGEGHCRIELD